MKSTQSETFTYFDAPTSISRYVFCGEQAVKVSILLLLLVNNDSHWVIIQAVEVRIFDIYETLPNPASLQATLLDIDKQLAPRVPAIVSFWWL